MNLLTSLDNTCLNVKAKVFGIGNGSKVPSFKLEANSIYFNREIVIQNKID